MAYVIRTLSGSQRFENPPDGGWGWVVVFALFWINALALSVFKMMGMFYFDIKHDLHLNNSETSLVISIMASCFGLSGLISNILIKTFGTRKVIMVGGLLSSFGLILFSLSHSLFALSAAAFINALGSGSAFIASTSQLNLYFKTRRTLANGIALAGSPIYSAVFPYIALYLVDIYGWRGTFVLVAGFKLHICAFGALIRPIEYVEEVKQPQENIDFEENQSSAYLSCASKTVRFFRTYWLCFFLLFANFLLTLGFQSPFVYIVPFSKELGFSTTRSASLLSFTYIGDIISRPLCGFVMGRLDFVKQNMLLSSGVSILVFTFFQLLPIFCHSWTGMVVYSLSLGFMYGVIVVLTMTAVPMVMGANRLNTYYSWFFCSGSVSTFLSGYLVGFIVDSFHTYSAAFKFTAISSVATAMWTLMCHAIIVKRRGNVIIKTTPTTA